MIKYIIAISFLAAVNAKPGFAGYDYPAPLEEPCDPAAFDGQDPVIIDAYSGGFEPQPAFHTPVLKANFAPTFYSAPVVKKYAFGPAFVARAAPVFAHSPTHFVARSNSLVVKSSPVLFKSNPLVLKAAPVLFKANPLVLKANPFLVKAASLAYASSHSLW